MEMDQLKTGVIGVGHMGQYHVNVLAGLPVTHELVGVYDANSEQAANIAEKFKTRAYEDIDELLAACDAVTIAVPTRLHYETAARALEAGCHVLLEKPITLFVEEGEKLVKLATGKNRILQVGHVERFNGAVSELNKIVENPLLIESRRLAPYNGRIKDTGVVFDLMIHDIDIVVNLVKKPIVGIQAFGQKIYTDHEDVASVIMQFENGCVANISASRATQSKVRTLAISQEKNYLFLNYSDQDIDIHRQAASAYLMTKDEIKYSQESFVEKLYIHKDNPLKLQHIYFRRTILGEVEPIVSGEDDVNILRVTDQIRQMIHDNMPKNG